MMFHNGTEHLLAPAMRALHGLCLDWRNAARPNSDSVILHL